MRPQLNAPSSPSFCCVLPLRSRLGLTRYSLRGESTGKRGLSVECWQHSIPTVRRYDRAFVAPNDQTNERGASYEFHMEELQVYQRAVDVAERIDRLTQRFASKVRCHLVGQLRRASLAISLNIAEGTVGGIQGQEELFLECTKTILSAFRVELCRRQKLIGSLIFRYYQRVGSARNSSGMGGPFEGAYGTD